MAKLNFSRSTIIALALTGVLLTVTTFGALTATQNLPSSGAVYLPPLPSSSSSQAPSSSPSPTPPSTVNVGVYSDSACTNSQTSIDWGTITPGNNVVRTVYVKNTGNTAITLSMTPAGWNPLSANGPIAVSWNREGVSLSVGSSISATLTLSVSSSISGIATFSVNIMVSGSG